VRLAEFGAFVEIFPGTDGLLHVSEIAEHRVNDVKDELREGDQVLVKVLALEGNRIKLSRKAILKEQRAKMGLPEPEQGGDMSASAERSSSSDRPSSDRPSRDRGDRDRGPRLPRPAREPRGEAQPASNASTITIESEEGFEGGADFDEEDEPNFNVADDAQPNGGAATPGQNPRGGPRPGGAGGPGGRGRRRRGGRRPGGSGGGGGNRG